MAPDVSNPQDWAQQHPQLAAELQQISEPVDGLDEALAGNQHGLMEMGFGTGGWLVIAAVLADGVEDWGWSPWWLAGVALALLIAITGLIQFIGLLWDRRQIQRAIAEGGER